MCSGNRAVIFLGNLLGGRLAGLENTRRSDLSHEMVRQIGRMIHDYR